MCSRADTTSRPSVKSLRSSGAGACWPKAGGVAGSSRPIHFADQSDGESSEVSKVVARLDGEGRPAASHTRTDQEYVESDSSAGPPYAMSVSSADATLPLSHSTRRPSLSTISYALCAAAMSRHDSR